MSSDRGPLLPFFLSATEIDALAIAVAKSVMPNTKSAAKPRNALEASRIIWAYRDEAGPTLCSLATMLAEARV